jgi:hypothetical protein
MSPRILRSRNLLRVRLVAPAVLIAALVLLTSAPPANAATVHVLLERTPPYGTGVLYAPPPQSSGFGNCTGSNSLLRAPSFNFTSGVAKFESRTSVPICGVNESYSAYDVESGINNLSFWIKSSFTGNVSVHWLVSGEFKYTVFRRNSSGEMLLSYYVALYFGIRDMGHPNQIAFVQGAREHDDVSPPYTANGTSSGKLNITFWGVPTLHGISFVAGHHYEILTYLAGDLSTFSDPGIGPGHLNGTLDFATGSYGATLEDFELSQ